MTEMNLEISQSTATQLSVLKGKFLMRDNVLYRITDYVTEEVTETPKKTWLNSNPKPKTKLILKSIRILGYNSEGRFLGTFDESTCRRLVTFFDLYYFRNTWIVFNEQLKAFGFEIREIDKSVEQNIEKAAEDHLKEFFKNEGYENQRDIIKYAVSFAKNFNK